MHYYINIKEVKLHVYHYYFSPLLDLNSLIRFYYKVRAAIPYELFIFIFLLFIVIWESKFLGDLAKSQTPS